MEEELRKISNRIKEMRREHNVTQKQLAVLSGTDSLARLKKR